MTKKRNKVVGSVTNVTILVTRSKNAIIALLSDLVNNGVTLSLGQDNVRLSYLAGPVISHVDGEKRINYVI
jgi:hypothetical protein